MVVRKKKHKTNKLFVAIAIPTTLIVAFYVLAVSSDIISPSKKQMATMLIISNESHTRMFTGEAISQMTILEALFASAKGGEIKISYSVNKHNNVYVSSIDNVINGSNNKYWYFYLNKKLLEAEDINKTFVKNGDIIEARFY